MAIKTASNIGLRKNFKTLGFRNFENDGVTQYVCNREPLQFMGTTYHVGQTINYDGSGAYTKAGLSQLGLFWEQEWIIPLT